MMRKDKAEVEERADKSDLEEKKGDWGIIDAYTLCDDTCSDGVHNSDRERCERCGALIHVRVYDVLAPDGSEMTVGSECLENVLGYRPGPRHQRAREFALWLSDRCRIRPGCRIRVSRYENKAIYVEEYGRWIWYRAPRRVSEQLLRAGADLGIWTYPREIRYCKWDTKPDEHEVQWLGLEGA